MDHTIEVLASLQAQIEQTDLDIMDLMNPSQILNPLRSVYCTELDERHTTRVRQVIRLTVANPLPPIVFNSWFQRYLNLAPSPPLQPRGIDIIVDATAMTHVLFDGINGVTIQPFGNSEWAGLTLAKEPRAALPPYLCRDDGRGRRFRTSCRLLANVMIILNIYGQRFIRGRTLLNIFNAGNNFGALDAELSSDSARLLLHMHSVPSATLWEGVARRNVIIEKWQASEAVADNNDQVLETFLRVAWE